VAKVEKLMGVDNLYEPRNIEILHHVNQALKAHALFRGMSITWSRTAK
jgi:preprotein translocase subunit SecA